MRRAFLLGVLFGALAASGPAAANPQIAGLQVALRAKGLYAGPINAVAGRATVQAVRRVQRRAGLKADGLAGLKTRLALGRLGRPLYGRRTLRSGLVGWDVAVLQYLLARRGYSPGTIDGHFGPHTEAALRRFEHVRLKRTTGIAGLRTLATLCPSSVCLAGKPSTSYVRYVVREGDTLTGLAERYRSTIAAIARLNRLDPHGYLVIGTRLRIPVTRV